MRGICDKPRVKCAACTHRRLLPLTDDVIRWHLSDCDPEGEPFVVGVYPLLQDKELDAVLDAILQSLRCS